MTAPPPRKGNFLTNILRTTVNGQQTTDKAASKREQYHACTYCRVEAVSTEGQQTTEGAKAFFL